VDAIELELKALSIGEAEYDAYEAQIADATSPGECTVDLMAQYSHLEALAMGEVLGPDWVWLENFTGVNRRETAMFPFTYQSGPRQELVLQALVRWMHHYLFQHTATGEGLKPDKAKPAIPKRSPL